MVQKLRKLAGREEGFDRVVEHFKVYEVGDFDWVFEVEDRKFSSDRFYEFSHNGLEVRVEDFSGSSHSFIGKMVAVVDVVSFFIVGEIYEIFDGFQ